MKLSNNSEESLTNNLVTPTVLEDLPWIYQLFDAAIQFQREHQYTGWKSYDKTFIQKDVEGQLLFKVAHESGIAGIFCVCYHDELIWRKKERGDAIYLHRIVVNRDVKAGRLFEKVLRWAIDAATSQNLRYIRMDTWAENLKIIDYYMSYGFRFVENYTTADAESLPIQHRNLKVALLEMDITENQYNINKADLVNGN